MAFYIVTALQRSDGEMKRGTVRRRVTERDGEAELEINKIR